VLAEKQKQKDHLHQKHQQLVEDIQQQKLQQETRVNSFYSESQPEEEDGSSSLLDGSSSLLDGSLHQKTPVQDAGLKSTLEPYRSNDSSTLAIPEKTRSLMLSGNIGKLSETSIRNYFSSFGKIVNYSDTSRVKRSEGWKFVFVQFRDYSAVDKAVGEFDNNNNVVFKI
jgi:hypothetical protein